MRIWTEDVSEYHGQDSTWRDALYVVGGIALAILLVLTVWWLGSAQKEGWERGVGIKYGCVPGEEVYVYESCKVVSE